jgi:hypothetical protein
MSLAATPDGEKPERAKDHEDHEQEPEDEHPVDLEVPEDLGEGDEQRRSQLNPGQIPIPPRITIARMLTDSVNRKLSGNTERCHPRSGGKPGCS